MAHTHVYMTLALLVAATVYAEEVLRLPPRITLQPKSAVYSSDTTVIMECEADGVPDVEFSWKRNGVDFGFNQDNVKRISETTGSFTYGPLTSFSDGYYQCFASNSHGKALSKMANLQRAVLQPLPKKDTQEYIVNQGDKLKLECERTKCYPPPTYSWVVASTEDDPNPQGVVLSKRIQQDADGNLYFSNVLSTDYPGKIYKCNIYNPDLEFTSGGSYSKLVINEGSPGDARPTKEYSTSVVTGLRGQEVELKCLFSGYPTPSVSWSRAGGSSLPIGRHDRINHDTTLQITELQEKDRGTYRCVGENKVDKSEVEITLEVDVIPVYEQQDRQPINMNKTNGEAVSFICDAYGKPEPSIQWFINGEPLDPNTPGPRRTISTNLKNLTIIDLCKDCGNDKTDLMVIQCNSSNNHGYAYAEGYLNVLEKTVLTILPEDVNMVDWESDVFFACEATTDDSTPLFMRWLFKGTEIDQSRPWYEVTPHGLHVLYKEMKDKADSIEGDYTCVANNGMSTSSATAHLVIPEAPIPVVKPAEFPLWLLILLIVLCLIIFLLICCCYCCLWMQRNKGDEYPVDEKERNAGLDPEQEIADSGFKDYQRPEDAPLNRAPPSLSSTIKLNESDDEDDLDEYGEPDTGKFNEEGSFIGQYQEKQRGRGNLGYHNDSVV